MEGRELKNIVAHKESKPEVEGKYLLFREQVNSFIQKIKADEVKEGSEKFSEYTVTQRWISGGENDGVRLRMKEGRDGSKKLFITKKNGETSPNGRRFTAEKEEEVKKENQELTNFFWENWETAKNTEIVKTRYIFDYNFRDDLRTVELDIFQDTDLTVAEVEFSGNTVDEAIISRDEFKSRKFFASLGLDSVKIFPDDKRFKNKVMARDRGFLESLYKETDYYSRLLRRVAGTEKKNQKKEEKEKRREAKRKLKA